MLEGFAEYALIDPVAHDMHGVVGCPPGTRCMRIVRLPYGWRIWQATRDFIYGTYLELHDNGKVVHFTVRADEGDDIFVVRDTDEAIRNKTHARRMEE